MVTEVTGRTEKVGIVELPVLPLGGVVVGCRIRCRFVCLSVLLCLLPNVGVVYPSVCRIHKGLYEVQRLRLRRSRFIDKTCKRYSNSLSGGASLRISRGGGGGGGENPRRAAQRDLKIE